MSRSEGAASSSTDVFNLEADYCSRIADLLERRLSRTLTLRLRETVQSAVEVAAAEWSKHLQSSLHRMEREVTPEFKTKLEPSSLVASAGSKCEAPASIVRDIPDDHIPGSPQTFRSESELSSIYSRTPPTWCKARNRRRQSRSLATGTVDDMASLEQRLAHGIFRARLGKCREEPRENSLGGGLGRPVELCPVPALGRSISFNSSISLSSEFNTPERSASLQAMESETPEKFEVQCSASRSMRSLSTFQSMATLQANQWSLATRRLYQDDIIDDGGLQPTRMRMFVKGLPRLLGVLPWNPRYKYSSMIYQAHVALLTILATIAIAMEFCDTVDDEHEQVLCTWLRMVLVVGGLLGLGACLFFNGEIVFANSLLDCYAARTDASETWDKRSFIDTCFVLVVFALCISLEYCYSWTPGRVESNCATVFVELLLLALGAQILRLTRCLCIVTDVYCNYVSECNDFEDAAEEWYLLYATCRSVCASIQFCFVVLQSVSIGALLFALVSSDIRMIPGTLLSPRMIPGVLCASVVAHLSICASSLTHKCERVPMLINSFSLGDLDAKRMYLVEYVTTSKTGFYLFNLQLSSSLVLKTFYIACAAAFSLTSQALLD